MRLLFINKQHKYKTPAALKPPFHHESPPDPEREENPTNLTVYLTETTPKNLNVLTADGAPPVLSLNLLLNSLRRLARSQPSSGAKRYRFMSTKPGHSQGVRMRHSVACRVIGYSKSTINGATVKKTVSVVSLLSSLVLRCSYCPCTSLLSGGPNQRRNKYD